jgi:hypothetical protein
MGTAPTGKRVYYLPSGAITKSGLYAPTTYIVSYWTNTATAYNIIGTEGSARKGRSQNGWTYFEHRVKGQGSISISGLGLIDELRMYPEKAQMTTMTYEPLIGVSSICDINSKILYYEYDELGRLILIRDQDRNIVKKVCYNYWQQAENCNIFFNEAQSGTFTKNNCGAGNAGSSVAYSVPAGTYISTKNIEDANKKAIADVNANGQNYANVVSTCNAPSLNAVQGYNAKTKRIYVKFTDSSSQTVKTLSLNPNTSSPYYLDSIPSGTYKVEFYTTTDGPVSGTFGIIIYDNQVRTYSQNMTNTTYVVFNRIVVNAGCQVYID